MFTETSAAPSKLRIPQGEQGRERIVPCTVKALKNGRLQITAGEHLTSGLAISVEHEDALIMGEVLVSVPKPHAWHIEIRVEHMLNGLMNLMALRARLLEEKPGRTPEPAAPQTEESKALVHVRPWNAA